MKQFLLTLGQCAKQISQVLMQKLRFMMIHKFHFRIGLELILKECDNNNFNLIFYHKII